MTKSNRKSNRNPNKVARDANYIEVNPTDPVTVTGLNEPTEPETVSTDDMSLSDIATAIDNGASDNVAPTEPTEPTEPEPTDPTDEGSTEPTEPEPVFIRRMKMVKFVTDHESFNDEHWSVTRKTRNDITVPNNLGSLCSLARWLHDYCLLHGITSTSDMVELGATVYELNRANIRTEVSRHRTYLGIARVDAPRKKVTVAPNPMVATLAGNLIAPNATTELIKG